MLQINLQIDAKCITPAVLEKLKAQVNNQLKAEKDLLLRYVAAHALFDAFEYGTDQAGTAANSFCEKHDLGWDGKDFYHKGYWFNRQFAWTEPNYADNDTDKNGVKLDYKGAVAKMDKCNADLKDAKKELKDIKIKIWEAHPNMKIEIKSVTFKLMNLFGVKPNVK